MNKDIEFPFIWRTSNNKDISIHDMETSHLFNTFRMIWNNFLPKYMAVGNRVKLYQFSPYYTRGYIFRAVKAIYTELMQRHDIKDYQIEGINNMKSKLGKVKTRNNE
jgi:hypothetical protein